MKSDTDGLFSASLVADARVMVVGCGALGNEVMKNLVLLGVRRLVIVDFDEVEMGNLNRSVLYSAADAKARRRKVEAARQRLQQMSPGVQVTAIDGDVAYDVGLALIRQMQVVIGCVDSRWARYCINRLCMRAGVPWVDGGIHGLEGTARVFAPGRNCYACNLGTEGQRELARRMPCSGVIRRNEDAGHAPTTPVIASIVGAVQAQEAMKLIHPAMLEHGDMTSLCGRVFYYEGQHLTTRTAHFIAYDDDCPVHEQWKPGNPTAVTSGMTVAEALEILRGELSCSDPAIVLWHDCFVDYVEDRRNGQHHDMRCAGHLVAGRMERDASLRTRLLSDFYQHEWRTIDSRFPYPRLTLRQAGIPGEDVLQVKTALRRVHLEMKTERVNDEL